MTLSGHISIRALPFVLASLFVSPAARAQETAPEVDRLFAWVTPTSPGCSISASLRGTPVLTRTYGLADLERNVAITSA